MTQAPTKFGRYRVVSELGRGAMGVVYKAEDSSLDRVVAVKTILLSSDAGERAEYEARFYQEAKAAGGLNHPHIITIHDIGREGDMAYMAMEFLEGVDLRELMARGRLPLAAALDFAAQIADGLAYAHEQGIVHRDIKPANIMIVRDTHAKIMDFGIARRRLSDLKTRTGAVLGSPKYMSPEQVAGERADQRSDVFALGVTLYEMVTGTPPFSGPDVAQVMYAISTATPRPPSSLVASLPAIVDLIVAKALAKVPNERYQTAYEFAADVRAAIAELEGRAPASPPPAAMPMPDAAADPSASAQTKTVKLGATLAAAPALQLSVSRRFDCTGAVQRLAELGAQPAAAPPGLQAWARDPIHQRLLGAALIGLVAAAAIALL